MISFKSFVSAIHDAIQQASDALMDKNLGLLDRYFKESETPEKNLVPKTVVLEFHSLAPDGGTQRSELQVPLITLVPLTTSRIERATLTADFEMEVVNGELQLDFKNSKTSGSKLIGLFRKQDKKKTGRLEVVFAPQETPEGLRLVVEAYEATLKQQIA